MHYGCPLHFLLLVDHTTGKTDSQYCFSFFWGEFSAMRLVILLDFEAIPLDLRQPIVYAFVLLQFSIHAWHFKKREIFLDCGL